MHPFNQNNSFPQITPRTRSNSTEQKPTLMKLKNFEFISVVFFSVEFNLDLGAI